MEFKPLTRFKKCISDFYNEKSLKQLFNIRWFDFFFGNIEIWINWHFLSFAPSPVINIRKYLPLSLHAIYIPLLGTKSSKFIQSSLFATQQHKWSSSTSQTSPLTPPPAPAPIPPSFQKSLKLGRPMSPHLQIYQPQLTWVVSIASRIAGSGLAVGIINNNYPKINLILDRIICRSDSL